jgi:ABC-type branched-subunit amino acid transport system substrate-binding protein
MLAAAAPGFGSSSAVSGPIRVMTVASVNYNGPNFKNIHEAARIYTAWINAKGGINGRKVEVTLCDDKGDPNLGAACARQAVAKKMVAVIGSFTFSGPKIMPILEAAKIPWFGICCPVDTSEFSSKMSFPLGNGFAVVAGHAFLAAKICNKINILNLDYPGAAFIELLTKNILTSLGQESKLTGIHVKIPLEVGGDLSPAVAEVTRGADCVISGLGEANWAAILPAIQQSGTKVQFFGAQGNLDNKVIGPYPELTTNWIVTGMYPDIAKPVWKDYRAAIKTYKADPKQDYNSLGGLGTWAAYTAFTKIASGVKGTLTNISFLNAANKTSSLDTGGMVPKIDFTKEWEGIPGVPGFNRLFNRAVTFQTIKNGKVVPFRPGFFDLTNELQGKP